MTDAKGRLLIGIFVTLYSQISFAIPTAEVKKIRGEVYYQGKKIFRGDTLKGKGLIKVDGKSFVKVFIEKWGSSIVVGPNSTMELNVAKEVKKKYNFLSGRARWIGDSKKAKTKDKPILGASH